MFFSYAILGLYYLNLKFFASNFESDQLWIKYKMDFNKTYSHEDEDHRKAIFQENLETLRFHNIKYMTDLSTFLMGINELSDMTYDEYITMQYDVKNADPKDITMEFLNHFLKKKSKFSMSKKDIPKSFDWRDHINMTSVKNQKNCGSCYAFATIAAVESFIYRKTGRVVDLSEQEIVDCSRDYLISGCNGGTEIGVLNYIIDHGINYEADYPYTGKRGKCRRNKTAPRYQAQFKRYFEPKLANSEDSLMRQLLLHGPVIVSIDHLHESFIRYAGGIYYEPNCSKKHGDESHIVLLVGYGSENGQDFWVVKNSFGKFWGEKGYFRIARNRNNHCLIASQAVSLYED